VGAGREVAAQAGRRAAGEYLETVPRSLGVAAATLSAPRDAFLAAVMRLIASG